MQLDMFAPAPPPPPAAKELDAFDWLMAEFAALEKLSTETTTRLEAMLAKLGDPVKTTAKPTAAPQPKAMSTISPAAADVIRRATITAESVTLPPGDLGKLYGEVKKVLEAAGGKWNTSAQAFLFKRDPRHQLAEALDSGKAVSTKKKTQAFYTPKAVVERCLAHAPALSGLTVLEPSAGEGAFADAIKAAGAEVICAEFDPESAAVLQAKGYQTHVGDFLQMAPQYGLYDAVVMNPPFAKGQDMKHVRHAFAFLKPGGTLLAIMSPAFTFASTGPAKDFAAFVAQHGAVVEAFKAGSFKESGTNVGTVLIKLAA